MRGHSFKKLWDVTVLLISGRYVRAPQALVLLIAGASAQMVLNCEEWPSKVFFGMRRLRM